MCKAPEVYLTNRVDSGQLSQRRNTEYFNHKVGPEQVGQELEDLELRVTHPHLSQEPSQRGVSGQEYGCIYSRSGFKLRTKIRSVQTVFRNQNRIIEAPRPDPKDKNWAESGSVSMNVRV